MCNKFFTLLSSLLLSFCSFANDGAYYASGNQLIPINEKTISIRKEVLSLKKVNNKTIEVTVNYEFFNPGDAKTTVVGFEAFSPAGDVDGTPKKGYHPYMHHFNVLMNYNQLKYKVAYVSDSLYAESGMIKSKDAGDIIRNIEDVNEVDFFYVYYFYAKFKKGLNTIKHTYTYDLSSSIENNYFFEYVLTAANRWANKQIDDFTLIIDAGECEDFYINKTFFTDEKNWTLSSSGKFETVKGGENPSVLDDAMRCVVQKGLITFKQKNFHPKGELFVYALNHFFEEGKFDSKIDYIPYSIFQQDRINPPADELSKTILKNLPFARRGYVFENKGIQAYFETMVDWYIPDPKYVAEVSKLTELEKNWVAKWN